MNIRMLTPAERERLAYIEGHPDAGTLGELVDTNQKLVQAENDLFKAEDELEVANALLDEVRELVNT